MYLQKNLKYNLSCTVAEEIEGIGLAVSSGRCDQEEKGKVEIG